MFVDSGESIDVEHTWNEEGTYVITVISYDELDLEGEPAILFVSMPKSKPYHDRSFINFLQNII
jgi:hypothetical protein